MPNLSLVGDGSPFDSIRQVDERGEFWSARDLQGLLSYVEWRKFCDAVDRARFALKAAGHKDYDHIGSAAKLIETGKGARREVVDYRLSRFGAYMVAMNGDPRKPEIAAAQAYFAVKTREAETVIPAMSAELLKLEAENRNMDKKLQVYEAQQKTLAAAGLLAMSAPAIAEAILLPGVTVIEKVEHIDRTVIVDTSGRVVSQLDGVGITSIQKQFGFKSTKAAWAWLESIGYGILLRLHASRA